MLPSIVTARVKACEATAKRLGLDASELLRPDQKSKRESNRSPVLFMQDDYLRSRHKISTPIYLRANRFLYDVVPKTP